MNDFRFTIIIHREETAMNDSKKSLFVGHSVVPVSASSFSVSLPGLRFTFTYTPMHKILTTRERVLPSGLAFKWRWLEHTA
ncbi:uncharacterized protein ARMOST_17801 [Armillaria ostoyae]|uniref:Uncharacterized protein n=1 Tax=Armillaria ostoyae TaxID=47428 RepID=A0A284S012_ARMOS|nr:uncharacterized protein ARMOST_17801 [Armillaria ostoyae]